MKLRMTIPTKTTLPFPGIPMNPFSYILFLLLRTAAQTPVLLAATVHGLRRTPLHPLLFRIRGKLRGLTVGTTRRSTTLGYV